MLLPGSGVQMRHVHLTSIYFDQGEAAQSRSNTVLHELLTEVWATLSGHSKVIDVTPEVTTCLVLCPFDVM